MPTAPRATTVAARDPLAAAAMVGCLLLIALNVGDLITTAAFLHRGVTEGNPLARVLLDHGGVAYVKAAALGALAWRVARRPASIGPTVAVWFVSGVYAMVVAVNLLLVAAAR